MKFEIKRQAHNLSKIKSQDQSLCEKKYRISVPWKNLGLEFKEKKSRIKKFAKEKGRIQHFILAPIKITWLLPYVFEQEDAFLKWPPTTGARVNSTQYINLYWDVR